MTDGDEPPLPESTIVHLHPRAVPVRHAFAWYEEAMRLWKRAPATWGMLAFVTVIADLLLERLPGAGSLVGKLITPLIAAGMVVAAFAADRGVRVRIAHAFAAFVAPAGAIAAIIAASVATFAGEAATAWWVADVNLLSADTDTGTLSFAAIIGIYFAGVLVSLPFTFVPFHVLLERSGAGPAFGASFRAFSVNALPLIVYGLVSLLLLAFGIASWGIGLLIALPLIVAASYAAWKDIFGVRVETVSPEVPTG